MLPSITGTLSLRRAPPLGRQWLAAVAVGLSLILPSVVSAQNLLRNPGFEDIPGPASGQALLPSEWDDIQPSPDTYSNDGSYGLLPSGFGNFTGVTSAEGLRWVAAWSIVPEQIGQTLSAPLVPGAGYRLSGQLHVATRSDVANPGGYRVLLADAANTSQAELAVVGPTTLASGWETFVVDFVAPMDADVRPLLIFDPIADPPAGGGAYPGLDDLLLEAMATTAPSMGPGARSVLIFGMLSGYWLWQRRAQGYVEK